MRRFGSPRPTADLSRFPGFEGSPKSSTGRLVSLGHLAVRVACGNEKEFPTPLRAVAAKEKPKDAVARAKRAASGANDGRLGPARLDGEDEGVHRRSLE